ncbi:exodeoxyribonuclease V subunit gamma [Klebsiella michiganensis]|uniref:Exodeoxyribonuclease V subunit gamma n=1 Tax=Klebsiella michiganensis TaxID=1134687 RepID=A0A7H4M6W1_9ENTR|nr:exodeoxyribonuclease V subunit gamma [Klebsiella michiganensis]
MLRVYHSNRLDVLEALMEFIVERQRLDDPFMPEMVLVQSTGDGAVAADDAGAALWDCGQH